MGQFSAFNTHTRTFTHTLLQRTCLSSSDSNQRKTSVSFYASWTVNWCTCELWDALISKRESCWGGKGGQTPGERVKWLILQSHVCPCWCGRELCHKFPSPFPFSAFKLFHKKKEEKKTHSVLCVCVPHYSVSEMCQAAMYCACTHTNMH